MRKSRIIEHVSTRDCQECGRVSLIEDVHEGGSMAWTLRDRQGAGRDDHHITVVSPTMMYYRWAVSEGEDGPES